MILHSEKSEDNKQIMNKIKKGTHGYISYRKKTALLRTGIYFCAAAVIFLAGLFFTKTWVNIFSAAAVLVCVPAVIAFVRLCRWLPFRSADHRIAEDLSEKAPNLTSCFDLILRGNERYMPVDCAVLCGNTFFAYTHYPKADPEEISAYIKNLLEENGFCGYTVRVLGEYKAFLARAEGLDHIAAVEKTDTGYENRKICRILRKNSL